METQSVGVKETQITEDESWLFDADRGEFYDVDVIILSCCACQAS